MVVRSGTIWLCTLYASTDSEISSPEKRLIKTWATEGKMREPPEPPMTAYNEEEEEDDDDEGREECVVGLRMMEADVEDSGLGREMKNKSANAGKQGTRWDGMGWDEVWMDFG